jgi:anaerobic magnesium-protoporphyrin IX monomethyl ester cyclase
MCDVLLVTLPPKRVPRNIFAYPPLGLAYLASSLEREGIDVKILDLTIFNLSENEIIKFLKREEPKIVGITATSAEARSAIKLAELIKQTINAVVVLGGIHVSSYPTFIDKWKIFDYGFVGEGEITFPIFAKKILSGGKWEKRLIIGRNVENLDSLPFPAYHLLQMRRYRIPLTSKRMTRILSSRGCPFNCVYCSLGKKVPRFRSPDNIVEEIKLVKEKYKVEWIQFSDDTFTLNKTHVANLCKRIIEEKIDIEWGCLTRCDLVDRHLLKLMYKAGCREIGFGIESGSEKIRINIKSPPIYDSQVIRAFKLCKKNDIETMAFFLFGLPNETLEDMKKTIYFPIKINADYAFFGPTRLWPATPLFKIAVKEGLVESDVWDKYAEGKVEVLPTYIPKGFSLESLYHLVKKAFLLFYLRPSYAIEKISSMKDEYDIIRFFMASWDLIWNLIQ